MAAATIWVPWLWWGAHLSNARQHYHTVVGNMELVKKWKQYHCGKRGQEVAGGDVPGVLCDGPTKEPLNIAKLEGALANVGHHVYQLGEHHNDHVNSSMASPGLQGHFDAVHHMSRVNLIIRKLCYVLAAFLSPCQ